MRAPEIERAALLAGAILAACTPPAPAPTVATMVVPPAPTAAPAPASTSPSPVLADPLPDGAAARTKRRCLLARVGPVRFSERGDVVSEGSPGQPLSNPHELVVVAERPSVVRVLVESEGARLLLVVERADLLSVPVADVVLAPEPGAASSADAGVRVSAGFPLEEKARQGGHRRLAGSSGAVTFEGWLPESALGEVFEAGSWKAVDGDSLVREGAVVVGSPGGPEIARFLGPEGNKVPELAWSVAAEPGAPAGFQRIRYSDAQVEVRGMVKAADVRPRADGPWRWNLRGHRKGSGFRTCTRTGKLARGAPILAPGIKGSVGVAAGPVRVFYGDEPADAEGRKRVAISVWPFGFFQVLVRAADIGPDA